MIANSRKKRNFIPSLQVDDLVASSQEAKQNVVFQHFMQHIGTCVPRTCTLNFTNLGWQPKPLLHLESPVSEEELHPVIISAPKEKAPGPKGFIGLFFSLC
jgi:hypothetical protein